MNRYPLKLSNRCGVYVAQSRRKSQIPIWQRAKYSDRRAESDSMTESGERNLQMYR